MLIGPVVAVCGLVVLLLSVEVCVRRAQFLRRNPDAAYDDEEDFNHEVSN